MEGRLPKNDKGKKERKERQRKEKGKAILKSCS